MSTPCLLYGPPRQTPSSRKSDNFVKLFSRRHTSQFGYTDQCLGELTNWSWKLRTCTLKARPNAAGVTMSYDIKRVSEPYDLEPVCLGVPTRRSTLSRPQIHQCGTFPTDGMQFTADNSDVNILVAICAALKTSPFACDGDRERKYASYTTFAFLVPSACY
jgi:hypothetical protein